jgi:hypothetical protein
MTIWEITETALNTLNVPIAANVMISATDEALPDLYLVYQLISSPPILHAEDLEDMRFYRMQVTIYSRDGLSNLPEVGDAMVDAGFTKSAIRELPYNTETRHYGLSLEFIYFSDSVSESESY